MTGCGWDATMVPVAGPVANVVLRAWHRGEVTVSQVSMEERSVWVTPRLEIHGELAALTGAKRPGIHDSAPGENQCPRPFYDEKTGVCSAS